MLILPLIGAVVFIAPGLWAQLPGRMRRNNLPVKQCISLWPESWLVVKSRDLRAVQVALSLHHTKPCSWLEGFTDADQLFVAPPVRGWILIIGRGLPNPDADVDACFRFILDLSRKLGQVQFFSANHFSFHHAWVKADTGRIVRAYAWGGATLWQQGKPTSDELHLGLRCFDYSDPSAETAGEATAEANMLKVRLLARRWGLDPARIPEHFLLAEHGIAGTPAHRF